MSDSYGSEAVPGSQAVLALQDLDTSLDRHHHRRANLEQRKALDALVARRESLALQYADAASLRDQAAQSQASLEAELDANEGRKQSVSQRLYGGQVSASRELAVLADDLASLEARSSDLEDRVLEAMERREVLQATVDALEEETSALQVSITEAELALHAAEAAIDRTIETLEAERGGLSSKVAPGTLSLYEDLRRRLGGVVAASLTGNRCGGCHLSLPASELDRLRRLPAGAVATCEQCGRILVVTDRSPGSGRP